MKNISVIILVVVIALVLGMYLFSFQVSETEIAVVTRFGEAVATDVAPGLHPKFPAPIHKVTSSILEFVCTRRSLKRQRLAGAIL
jgi:regulator of protease activity HflC (stomatin/prohibitin superfamily)